LVFVELKKKDNPSYIAI